MSAVPELVYFEGRGRAEIVRLLLSACSLEFKEVPIKTREQFLDLKKGLTFGQVPLLKIDGKNLVQTNAIVRHLARAHSLYGKSEDERTKVDAVYEGTRDFYTAFLPAGFFFPLDKVKEKTADTVAKYLPLFEQILKDNGSNGYLVGNSLTFADIGLLEALLAIKDYYEPEVFEDFPEIEMFLKTVCQLPFFDKYSKETRKPKNSEEYVACVKEVLNV